MIELGSGHARTTTPPAAFFARWTDHDSWPTWSPDTEWVRVDGPVDVGATGVLKPVGGPRVRFTVTACTSADGAAVYTDTSRLPGARLVFEHTARSETEGTTLGVRVTIDGPLARVWARVMGGGFRESAQADLDRLVALVAADQQESIGG